MKEIRVASVLSDTQLVLNIGEQDGIDPQMRFLVYGISEEQIIDPVTKEPLGYLELVRGTGRVAYIQEKMCIISSDTVNSNFLSGLSSVLDGKYAPFSFPQVGDHVRII